MRAQRAPRLPVLRLDIRTLHPDIRQADFCIRTFEWVQHWGKEIESPLLHEKPRFKLDFDIAVCKVGETPALGPYQPLNIALHNLKLGDQAVAIGYAEMKNFKRV